MEGILKKGQTLGPFAKFLEEGICGPIHNVGHTATKWCY